MNTATTAALAETTGAELADRIRQEIDRALQRGQKGVEFLSRSGPTLGRTPKDVILERGTLALYHYRPMVDEVYRVPILLVMATTNKGYIMDLAPGQSLVEFLLKRGYDVFMMDWRAPRPEESRLTLDDYVTGFIPECVAKVVETAGESQVSIIAYCMGGVLALIYAALHPDGPIKNLICFTTPVNWHEMSLSSKWSDKRFFDVDNIVDTLGNVPAEMIYSSFDMLRPASRIAGQIQLWDNIWNDEFVKSFRMFDRWGAETLPLPGEYFRQITKELMWENKLYKNELTIGGRHVDLKKITVPLFSAVAEHDHIAPYPATSPLIQLVGSTDKQEVMLKGGHVSLIAGANAVRRLWPRLDAWLAERSI